MRCKISKYFSLHYCKFHIMPLHSPQFSHNPALWVVTEGIAGTENQCIGVANALNIEYQVKRISLNQPWKTLTPYIGFERQETFNPSIHPPWPNILITSGRKSVAVARYIKKNNQDTFSVHIQDPKVRPSEFDLIAVPRHDSLRGDNVIVTDASPNKMTVNILEDARQDFKHLSSFAAPRIAVLIGGRSKAYDMSEDVTRRIADQLRRINGSLFITCSRRTGDKNIKILKDALDHNDNFFWDGTGQNPYFGFLAWADYILVTADSASMISEGCSTGKPVFMLPLDGGAKRIKKLHDHLISTGRMRIFDGSLDSYTYPPLCDAEMVAKEIKKRYKGFTRET